MQTLQSFNFNYQLKQLQKMNVAQALSLRKPDRRFVSMGREESSTQQ